MNSKNIEIIYIDDNFSLNSNFPRYSREGFVILAEIVSENESFRIGWDKNAERFAVYTKEKNGDWKYSELTTYHQKKLENDRHSVTIGDYNGKMVFKGIFKIIL